jgi:hypothetical protein
MQGIEGAGSGDVRWPLVFVFFMEDGGGDLLRGTGSGSGVFFMAKVTFFSLAIYPVTGYFAW